jgi:hypothetical protein
MLSYRFVELRLVVYFRFTPSVLPTGVMDNTRNPSQNSRSSVRYSNLGLPKCDTGVQSCKLNCK